MDTIKTISDGICATLHEWGYSIGDMIHPNDLDYATWRFIAFSFGMVYQTCMCLRGDFTDFGDGFFMLTQEI